MLRTIQRQAHIYIALAAMVPKRIWAYNTWTWMQLFVRLLALITYASFWRAVYSTTTAVGGLSYNQTLNYILLAQIFLSAAFSTNQLSIFGELLYHGQLGIELLRPVDFQASQYVQNLAFMGVNLLRSCPLLLVALLFFDLSLPTTPLPWLAFIISLVLGNTVLFFFDWIVGCLVFYITEVWGLIVARVGIVAFFSGALVPLTMMPDWLYTIAIALPFAQALSFPVEILSGIRPVEEAPRIWLIQLIAIGLLTVLSRSTFRRAARKVTVQGG
jgi:ABC-2 type transport system permease protein